MSAPVHSPVAPDPARSNGPFPDPTRDRFFYGWRYVERKREDGTTYAEQVPLTSLDVLHPQEGDFIVNNALHDVLRTYLKNVLTWRTSSLAGALIFSDHRIDFQVEGHQPLGPDIAVFTDSRPWTDWRRGTCPVRAMGGRPLVVIELTSLATRATDLHDKVIEYSAVGVPLYVIVDLGVTFDMDLSLQAFRGTADGPRHLPLSPPNRVHLPPPLDLWLVAEGQQLVCLDPDGKPIGDYNAVARAAAEAERTAASEKVRADEAITKLKELEAEISRLRGESTK